MFWRSKPAYTPPPPKPMVARFMVHMKHGAKLTYSEEYNGAHRFNEPEPHVWDGMVCLGNHWINRDEIERIEVKYQELPK